MNFSNLFFAKDITDLTYEDVESFFVNPQDESNILECKSYYIHQSDKKTPEQRENDILENICAFLNSEGGLLIWGAPNEVKKDSKRTFQGTLTPFEQYHEKDSFIRKIAMKITPSPYGIQFHRIEKSNKYIYIIEVQKSNYAPHQFQSIYYMRLDGQTHKAPHYFVEALFRKITYPKLEGKVSIISIKSGIEMATNFVEKNVLYLEIKHMISNITRLQNEFDLYFKIKITPRFNFSIAHHHTEKNYNWADGEIIGTNVKSVLHYGQPFQGFDLVHLDYSLLEKSNHEVKIEYYFGGRQSPLLKSTYILNTGTTTYLGENYDNNYVFVKENQPIFDEL